MKKILIINILTIIFLIPICIKTSINYNNNLEKLNNIDNITYKEKTKLLEKEYNEIVKNLNELANKDIKEKGEITMLYDNLKQKQQEYTTENENLINTKNSLLEQKNVLNNQYNEYVVEEQKRKNHLINNVKQINQYNIGYPTGCESVALTILLNYWNVNVSVSDVADLLPKGDKPYMKNGTKYGGNPYLEFIGNPKDAYSYGVYDIPIQNVANNFKSGIINGQGKSLDEILEIVKQNRPVIVWSSMNMGIPHYTNSWIYEPTGEKINWLADLHAIVVIGYTENQVITTDSLTGTIRYFDKSTFESRYNAFGKRALYY